MPTAAPQSVAAFPQRIDECLDELKRSPDDFELLRQLAQLCLERGDFVEANKTYERMVRAHPANAEAHRLFACSLARVGYLEEAVNEFHNALRIESEDPDTHYNLAIVRAQQGRYDAAIDSFQKALRLQPDHADAHARLASVFCKIGRRVDAIALLRNALQIHPNRVETMIDLASILSELARQDEAVLLLQRALRLHPVSSSIYHALASTMIRGRRWSEAESVLQQALRLDPHDVTSHLQLAVLYKRSDRMQEALSSMEIARTFYRLKPAKWEPEFGREVAELGTLLDSRDSHGQVTPEALRPTSKPLTILIGCYGDFPSYSIRALSSIASGKDVRRYCDVVIGLNQCCGQTITAARGMVEAGLADAVIECRSNLNKDPMMRNLIALSKTTYVMWLDDDSHFVDMIWPEAMSRFIEREHPFDAAGQTARWGPRRDLDPKYMNFMRARPWWRTDSHQPQDLREWVPFVVGGLFLARTAFLREHNFPDQGMTKAMDDVALGELMHQVGGRMVGLPPDVLHMMRISDGHRRGENFVL